MSATTKHLDGDKSFCKTAWGWSKIFIHRHIAPVVDTLKLCQRRANFTLTLESKFSIQYIKDIKI